MLGPLKFEATPAIPPVIPPAGPGPPTPGTGFGLVSMVLIIVRGSCGTLLPFGLYPDPPMPPGGCPCIGVVCTPPVCELITAPVCVGVIGTNCPFASILN